MGLYDTLNIDCPRCGNPVEFQSKAGPCEMRSYHLHYVPVVVAHDLNGKVEQCRGCDQYVVVRIPGVVNTVAMIAEIS